MRDELRIPRWLAPILFVCATSALAANDRLGLEDDCSSFCFQTPVIVHVGDTVTFYAFPDEIYVYPLSVVADDGSFRYDMVTFDGPSFHFTPESTPIEFDTVGTVTFHVEPTGVAGVIYVLPAPPGPISAIDGSFTGAWFNAAQSGTGFVLEVLPGSPMQLLASWLTFAPERGPSWIVGLGPIDDDRATLRATQIVGSGARFPPNFDAANVQTQSWGVLTFTFSDCKSRTRRLVVRGSRLRRRRNGSDAVDAAVGAYLPSRYAVDHRAIHDNEREIQMRNERRTQEMNMRVTRGILDWLAAALLFVCATASFSATASGAGHMVGIGDDCDPGQAWPSPVPPYDTFGGACWWPATLTIDVGDRVYFYQYAENFFTGPHNVVADDGSFRCARGCDGEGGDGTPGSDSKCFANGDCGYDLSKRISFYRDFNAPGIVKYHDEVTGAPGVIYVGVSPPGPPANAVGTGYTGTWFNSAQSGMGFMLEVLPGPPMQMLAAWLTFSPEGGPSWIVGLGPVTNNQATLQATRTVGSGARFPPHFDPANVSTENWGVLTFTFADCNHGHVDWSSSIPEYVSGGMDLTRLTQPAGVACSGGAMVRPASGSASQ